MFRNLFSFTAGIALTIPSSATLLFVSSYDTGISTLNVSGTSLQTIASDATGCGDASWLTLDYANNTLYCLDEGLTSINGSLSSYSINDDDGKLEQLDKVDTVSGPVSSVVYADGKGLALAHYSGSAFSGFGISDELTLVQVDTFSLDAPGTNPARQDAPHPHEAILHPSGRWALVPDLGADLVRVFLIDETTLGFTAVEPLAVAPGSGPRHAAFLETEDKTYLYLVTELSNNLIGYDVTESEDGTGLTFTQVYISGTHGLGEAVANTTAAAEIHVSPDSNFLIVSSRNENTLSIPNFDATNATEIISDPLVSFSIDHATGNLTKIQEFPAGGRFPRQFSLSKDGATVGVGLQNDGRVVLISRDVETGLLKEFAASAEGFGQVTAVVFNE